MIGFIKGEIIAKLDNNCIVLLDSIGYQVSIASEVNVGDQIEVYIHTSVRENDISLWGFVSIQELEMFRRLISVNGVGLKTAFQLISEKGVNNIIEAIINSDETGLKVKGLGKKTSQRIIIDLKTKVASINVGSEFKSNSFSNTLHVNEAVDALISLGYKETDIRKQLEIFSKSDLEENVQSIIKKVLQQI